jgi:hypothetical protein
MSHIPLVEIRLREDECLMIEDMLYYTHLPNKERLHSNWVTATIM